MRPLARLLSIFSMNAMLLAAFYNYANDNLLLMAGCLFMAVANCILAIIYGGF